MDSSKSVTSSYKSPKVLTSADGQDAGTTLVSAHSSRHPNRVADPSSNII